MSALEMDVGSLIILSGGSPTQSKPQKIGDTDSVLSTRNFKGKWAPNCKGCTANDHHTNRPRDPETVMGPNW